MALTAGRETVIILDILDQAYNRKAWHGPNLRGSVRRLLASQAAWRPDPSRKCIAEHVLHTAYWKYTARRRLRGDKRGSFTLKGTNWFPVSNDLSETAWRDYVNLLDTEHRALREAVAALPPNLWEQTPEGSKYKNSSLILGIAAHDVYHAGQIQLLKRLQSSA
jgi:hypothetical protein